VYDLRLIVLVGSETENPLGVEMLNLKAGHRAEPVHLRQAYVEDPPKPAAN